MAFDESLADDVRMRLSGRPGLTEQKMFGGIAFMINGHMAVGVSGEELMVRVGKDAHEEAITKPGARTFDMGARPMMGWVSVAPEGFDSETTFDAWVDQGAAYAEGLPPK